MKPPAFQFYADDFLGRRDGNLKNESSLPCQSPSQGFDKGCDKPRTKMSSIINATRPCGASEWGLQAVWPTVLPFVTRCVAQAF
jgi:hypothetical protein